jgi:transposase-like protein
VVYTQEFKSKIIEEVKEINSISPVAKKHSIPTSTIHGWVQGSKESVTYKKEIKNKTLKNENKNLRNKLADAELELMILKDLLKKSYNA